MSRYIDADKLKEHYMWWGGGFTANCKDGQKEVKKIFDEIIDLQPTADVRENVQLDACPLYGGVCGYPSGECYDCPRHGNFRENVKGEWIRKKDTACCSNCGAKWTDHIGLTDTWYYCPNCGADMRGEA